MRKLISTGSQFEEQIGYARAVVEGNWCFMSGVTGYDYTTMTLSTDTQQQVRMCFETIERVLGDAGFSMPNIVRVTHYIANRQHIPLIIPILGEKLGHIRPAATMVIAGLMEPDMHYEIEVTAYRGE